MPVIDKPIKTGLNLKAELKLFDAPHREEHWEGIWTFLDETSSNSLRATARLLFGGDLVEGRGVMTYKGERVLDIDISGAAAGDDLTFATYIANGDDVHGSLDCAATITGSRTLMKGTFKHGCINPLNCEPDCTGGWGEFEMQRIVEEG
jgi:hypothetical protein